MDARIKGNNIATMRENNLALILRILRRSGECSRADLAHATGLKQATITYIIGNLIQWGVVRETGFIEGRKGRRSVGILLNGDAYAAVSVRLNRQYVKLGVFDLFQTTLAAREYKIDPNRETPEAVMRKIQSGIEGILPKDKQILGIGVAVPGPFVRGKGAPELISGFAGWNTVDIRKALGERFDLPVLIEQDANCGILAEQNAGQVDKSALYIAADVGIGSGLLTDGTLYTGALGTAGEIGHITIDYNGARCECGNRGCLELYASTPALENRYCETYGERRTADEILALVRDGDRGARALFARLAGYLAAGIASAVNLLNPEVIILADKLASAGEFLVDCVKKELKSRLLDNLYRHLEIRLDSFPDRDGMLIGGAELIWEDALQAPSDAFGPNRRRSNS